MRTPFLLLLISGILPAMDLQGPVDAYWELRGNPPDRRDLTIHHIGTVVAEGDPLSLYYYRYAILGDEDGGTARERELLLAVLGERLDGWYQITGTDERFALARIVGEEAILPSGLRRKVWPLPPVLSETVTIAGKEEVQQYLFHAAGTGGAQP